ncbi:GTPase IMAP family member 7-like [Pomacea canaliculata]|uniref:GTPase IMAP family member 7-like n=1 Tax=Pomacea canaliculata TaxID=400727 RepID=UPI000D734C40|nr:GTPase IMAP family member 7-like [Pomacea canaliculata]
MSAYRILLIGRIGNGKSTVGNTILGKKFFDPQCGMCSVTGKCEWKKASRYGYDIEVTDTPGVCDTGRSDDGVEMEIAKCVATMVPGPDAICFVIRGSERFTKEEMDAYENFKTIFGQEMTKYLILVFTRVTQEEFQEALQNKKKPPPPTFLKLLEEAGNRFVCFSNDLTNKSSTEQEAIRLLQRVVDLKIQNNGSYYSDDLVKWFDHEVTKEAEKTGHSVDKIKEELIKAKNPGLSVKGCTVM